MVRPWVPRSRTVAVAAALAAVLSGVLAAAQPALAAVYVPVSGAGSTWAANAIQAWSTAAAQDGMSVSYGAPGSTSGLQEFANGTVDFGASEVPYGRTDGGSSDPPPTRGYAYMPDVAGGVALMYNLQIGGRRVTNLRLSGATIAGIFTGQITSWDDPRVAADNPGLTLPAVPVVPVVRTDSSGETWYFTQWLDATQKSAWTAYCTAAGIDSCGPASTYPVASGSAMVGRSGDLGVSGYVSQQQADGAIGITEYSYALETGFPVASVLNAGGYYTQPTAGNVGLSLRSAQVNQDAGSPQYLTEDLSGVYADSDPRAYELSYYSYLVVPADSSDGFTSAKGYTLGAFGSYLLCRGQQQVDALGYAALPVNLVEAGLAVLQQVPGNAVPGSAASFLPGCADPALAADGTDLLASTDPMPPACDAQGTQQCAPVSATTTALSSADVSQPQEPDTASAGDQVTCTAHVSASDGSKPAGTVTFSEDGTIIGDGPVTSGTLADGSYGAQVTTSFASPGSYAIDAVFTPADTSAYASSDASVTEGVAVTGALVAQVPVTLTVPQQGTFTMTADTDPVRMTVDGGSGTDATGDFGVLSPAGPDGGGTTAAVEVTDTRNYFPGWSVTGQVSDFQGTDAATAGHVIAGNQLGWTPSTGETFPASGPGEATLGPVVTPAAPGLGSAAATLIAAPAGSGDGTYDASALLDLQIPAGTAAGGYSATLTVTAVTSAL